MHHVSLLVCSYTRKEKYLVLLLERHFGCTSKREFDFVVQPCKYVNV